MLFVPVALPPPPPPHACLLSIVERDDERPESVGSIVSAVWPIRVHWTADGYQDSAAIALEAAELAWQVQVDELGFAAPVLPDEADGPELDIYLADLGAWEGYAWAPNQVDHQAGDGRMGAPAYIGIDRDLPVDWLPSYVAHEFSHVLQYATDFNEASVNIWEATAVAAQQWTLGLTDGMWDVDVPDFQATPWAPVLLGDGYGLQDYWSVSDSYYEYGAAAWILALDAELGDGAGSIGPALWEAAAGEGPGNEPDVLDAVAELAGGSLADALDVIARRRWRGEGLPGSSDWDDSFHPELLDALSVDDLPLALEPEVCVTGQSFVTISGLNDDVHLNADVRSDAALGSSVIEWSEGGLRVVAMSNLGPDGFDPDEDDAWEIGDQVLQLYLDGQAVPQPDGAGCSCQAGAGDGASGVAVLALFLAVAPLRRRRESVSRGSPRR